MDKICSIEWCNKPLKAKGYCAMHYWRASRGLDMEAAVDRLCCVDGCENVIRSDNTSGYCRDHINFSQEAKTRKQAWAEANPEKVSEGRKAWRETNPDYHKGYYILNSEKLKQAARDYRMSPQGQAKEQERKKRPKSREEIERGTRRVNEWRERNPEAFREQSRNTRERRRAAELSAENPLTTTEWLIIVEEFGAVCFWCSAPWEVMDHVMPLALGGEHTKDNVVPACVPCNSRKAAKHPVQFWLEINGR